MVIDFRALNEKKDRKCIPSSNITETLGQLGSTKHFSIFDLASRFHQIPMDESDESQKTVFSTLHGHYHLNQMSFGLKNVAFRRLMNQVLSGLQRYVRLS